MDQRSRQISHLPCPQTLRMLPPDWIGRVSTEIYSVNTDDRVSLDPRVMRTPEQLEASLQRLRSNPYVIRWRLEEAIKELNRKGTYSLIQLVRMIFLTNLNFIREINHILAAARNMSSSPVHKSTNQSTICKSLIGHMGKKLT